MKIWQAVGCAVVCLVSLIGLIIGVVFFATSGITDTADDFFAAVKDGQYETAQEYTSKRLRESTSAAELQEFIEFHGLGDVVDTSWASRSIKNTTGELVGTVETESGATIPISILFVSEGDEWRIDGFDIQTPSLTAAQSAGSQNGSDPVESAMSSQIDQAAYEVARKDLPASIMWLDTAWEDGDYLLFSTSWKDRPNPRDLAARYPPDGLRAEEIALLEQASAEIETAKFDDAGRLVVGFVREIPSKTVRTVFTYENVPEAERKWQIVDLEIDTGEP